MNTQQLDAFIQVAETLNFAHAARALNVTQSAVSRQIHALEEELNAKLFYRTTRTVALTPEGIIFLEHAKQIQGHLKMAAAKLHHHTSARTQMLTIGCESEVDLDFLCGTLSMCRQQIMAFHPILRVMPHRALLNLFYQGEIQVLFGLRENLPIQQDVVFLELERRPLCCVLPSAHPYAKKKEIDEVELFSQHLILCTSDSISPKAVELQNRIAQHISPERIHVSSNPQAILTLIRAGYGCSILPMASGHDPAIAYVPLKNAQTLTYGVIYDRTSNDSVLKRFVEVVERAPAL